MLTLSVLFGACGCVCLGFVLGRTDRDADIKKHIRRARADGYDAGYIDGSWNSTIFSATNSIQRTGMR